MACSARQPRARSYLFRSKNARGLGAQLQRQPLGQAQAAQQPGREVALHQRRQRLGAGCRAVVGRGRLITEGSVDDVVRQSGAGHVRVDSADPDGLRALLVGAGAHAATDTDGALVVTGMDARTIGTLAGDARITLYELSSHAASLEQAFFDLTRDATDYTTRGAAA